MASTINSTTPSTATQSYTPPVVNPSAAALASQAVSLSTQSAVVATLGGVSSSVGVYSPTGLLNSLTQAGSAQESLDVPKEGSNTDTSNTAQDAQDQGLVSNLGGSASSSGVYSGAGTVTNPLSEQASSNWADLLKTNPNLASTVISYSYAAGIVSTLQVTA